MPLLWRSSLRHFMRHPWQLGLAVLGIALGVAVVVAVDLSIASARRAFSLSVDAVSGRATHQITGGPTGLPDSVYTRVRIGAGIRASAPIVEGLVRVMSDSSGRTLRLLGVDPFAEAPFRPYADAAGAPSAPGALLVQQGAVLVAAQTAQTLGLTVGDSFALRVAGTRETAVLAGILDPADALSRQAIADLMIADIATAQELLGAVGRIDRIDLRLPADSVITGTLDRIRAVLPPGAMLTTTESRAAATAAMTRAFELNLTALGLLALVFGTFLIYNSMTFSVVQRRSLIGLLRAQGVTRSGVLQLVLLESAAIGVVATALGVLAGRVLGSSLIHLVTRTINDLYFRVSVTDVSVSAGALGKAALLGIGATVLATLPAAREAATTAPRNALLRSLLEEGTHRTARRAGLIGAALVGAAILALALPARSLALGLGALFILLFGAALLVPLLSLGLVHIVQAAMGRTLGLAGRMATRGVAQALSRTGPAIAALTVAIAAGAAIAIMIGSFRDSVERWLDATLLADVYIASPSSGANRRETGLDPLFVARVRAANGVAGVSTYRSVMIERPTGSVQLVAVDLFARHRDAFTFLEGAGSEALRTFDQGGLLVSEPLAYRLRLHVGDSLELTTRFGPHRFRIAGIIRDYASEFGVAFLDRSVYDTFWDDPGISSIGVFAAEPSSARSLLDDLRRLDTGEADVLFQPSAALRASTLRVFDRTFAITFVLRGLALLVALVGVLAALLALQLERTRELGVLRATGFTPRQIGGLVLGQSALLGAMAGAFAIPLAFAMSWAMVGVINRRAFGWTIDLRLDGGALAESVLLAVVAAFAAGLLPAFRMARILPADALREE
jgi:putative ABC transport system permease protein